MSGYIGTSVTSSLNHTQLQRYCYSKHFQFAVAHALGFSVFISRLLATDLNIEISTSNITHKVFSSQPPVQNWTLYTLFQCGFVSLIHGFSAATSYNWLLRVRARVGVTLRLAVYGQSVCFIIKPLETHGQNFFFSLTLAVVALM
jgi:hypothetical protein